MAATEYTYSIQNDFPQNSVSSDLLTVEIGNSTIVPVLLYIATAGDVCSVWFADALSGPEALELDAVVAAHQPIGAPPSVVDLRNDTVIDGTWAEFKTYLDGTVARLYFYSQEFSDQYVITTDKHGGFRHRYTLPFTDTADKTEFETSFLPLQGSRIPYEQVGVAAKDSTITYLLSGDIDKIETVVGDQKLVDQFVYNVNGDIEAINRTVESV